jgi:hypothetical protein
MAKLVDLASRVNNKLASVGVSIPGDEEKVEWMNDAREEFATITDFFYATGLGITDSTNSYPISDFVAATHGDYLNLLRIWVLDEEHGIKSWEWIKNQIYYKWRGSSAATTRFAYQDSPTTFSLYPPAETHTAENLRVAYSYVPARMVYGGAELGTWYTEDIPEPRIVHKAIVNFCVGSIFVKMGETVKGKTYIDDARLAFRAFAMDNLINRAADWKITQPDLYVT